MGKLTSISKYISLILRHKPEVAGIELDKHGWANVGELIRATHIDMNVLEKIVSEDEKGRYEFNYDRSQIRARQGHSVNVDVGLEEAEPPSVLYHGTADRFMNSINKEGLIAKSRLYVHLSSEISTAEKVGSRHGNPVILGVNAKEMYKNGYKFYISRNGVWLTKRVRPEYISRIGG